MIPNPVTPNKVRIAPLTIGSSLPNACLPPPPLKKSGS